MKNKDRVKIVKFFFFFWELLMVIFNRPRIILITFWSVLDLDIYCLYTNQPYKKIVQHSDYGLNQLVITIFFIHVLFTLYQNNHLSSLGKIK